MNRLCSFMLFTLVSVAGIAQELEGENLLQGMPGGYKVGYQVRQGDMLLVEMVPENETVEDWSEMLTTQIFYGGLPVTTDVFYQRMASHWKKACNNADDQLIKTGEENGYPFTLWLLTCRDEETEITWFKAIKGNDSFYLVQKAWRREPAKEEITKWMPYLRSVTVCDTRIPESACAIE